jgi:hypothetical protein
VSKQPWVSMWVNNTGPLPFNPLVHLAESKVNGNFPMGSANHFEEPSACTNLDYRVKVTNRAVIKSGPPQ